MAERASALLLFAALGAVEAGEITPKQEPPKPPAKFDFVVKMMESTVRLEGPGGSATAFILMFREYEQMAPALVLITAAHVFESMGDTCEITIRAATPDGTWVPATASLPIRQGGRKRWVRHPTADIAAMYVNLEAKLIPPGGFLTTSYLPEDQLMQKLDIRTADEGFTLSFPRGVLANEDGFPVLRSGHIASFLLYPTRYNKGFIMDTALYEGEYGAPVLVLRKMTEDITGVEMPKGRLGVIAGLIAKPHASTTKIQFQTVLPASMIRDTLYMLLDAELKAGAPLITPRS